MSDGDLDRMWDELKDRYNVPGETPREAMWSAISDRLDGEGGTTGAAPDGVVDLAEARAHRRESANRPLGWAVAAAAVLMLGIGIGRMTAPPMAQSVVAEAMAPAALSLAAREHLGRTESLLTMVRADARAGRVDPMTAEWAKAMLAQTRLLLDVQDGGEPAVADLLLDLELVLAQIVGVAEATNEGTAPTELGLALQSLEEGEVLPRIQAVLPNEFSGA